MPLIYDIVPLLNVERNVTLGHLMGGFSQTISCPFPHFPRIFLQVRVNDALCLGPTLFLKVRFLITVFSLTASLCKLWLNTVHVVTAENILLMDI